MPNFYKLNNATVGAQLINGPSAPTSGVGNNGDFYLQTSGAGTPKIWGPKANDAWPASGVSLATTVATDSIFDAAGDLPVGTGADTAARLAKGSTRQSLVVGSSTLEWDTNHFGGSNIMSSVETSPIAETLPPSTLFANGASPASGNPHLHGVYIPKNTTINYISFTSGITASTQLTNQWFALCDNTRKVLRVTSNDTTTAWATYAKKTLALSSSYTTTYSGLYYLACIVTSTGTMPSFKVPSGTFSVNYEYGRQSFTATPTQTTPSGVTEGSTIFAINTRIATVQAIVS